MSAYKDKNNTWRVEFRYKDWTGKSQRKLKRGFATRREALEWEREFLLQKTSDPNMLFGTFVEQFERDVRPGMKENTWFTKESIIKSKLLPYFAERRLSEISAKDIIEWQNELRRITDKNGKHFSPSYLKTVHTQLSNIFNHAVRFYGLRENPAAKVGNMAKGAENKEMQFWTREEYEKFSYAIMDKPMSYYAFEVLYWCGIREGELLALTKDDFDLENRKLRINKSYQRLKGEDVITTPKTPKSKRTISMSKFLCEEMGEYFKMLYEQPNNARIFPITKHYLSHEIERGCKISGVKRIRVHDLRHSHVSLLINMGFSALAIADRVGHESIDITYRYAHLFPTKQVEIADKLDDEKGAF